MNEVKKVAIYGSCVSRDIFMTEINPDYKKDFELVLFQNHTTLMSLMSPKINYNLKDFSNLNWRNLKMIKDELDKEFLNNLKNIKPDILIIDFFSEAKFETIKDGDSFLTVNNWKTVKTKHYENISKSNKPFRPTNHQLNELIKKLSIFLKKELKNTKIILNKTKAVYSFYDNNNIKRTFKDKTEIEEFNNRWTNVDKILEKELNLYKINENHNFIGDANHIWGISSVHYEKEYYISSLVQIENVVKNKKNILKYMCSKFNFS